jgi:fructokinase
MLLKPAHLDRSQLCTADVLHFGSISRLDAGPRAATDEARRVAAGEGAMITYDPNWRPSLWLDQERARERILEGFVGTAVAKVSDEEWRFITHTDDFAAGAKTLLELGTQLVVRSEGPGGASFATSKVSGHVDAFAVDCVDSLGAGDAAMACLIEQLRRHWRKSVRPGELTGPELQRIIRRANAVGALACTKVGAIPALPSADEVERFLARFGGETGRQRPARS